MGKERQRCKATHVWRGFGMGDWQCRRLADASGYCWQHSPDAVEARAREKQEKLDAMSALDEVRWHGPAFRDVLRKIANGHNDPANYAREVLEKAGLWEEQGDG